MNMPGFVAEMSLYKTGQTYRGYSGSAKGDSSRGVTLQQTNSADP